MKKFWLACTMIITVGISSCVDNDKDLYQGEPQKEFNTNDFSTQQSVQVDIDYSQTKSKVPFFIYDENPIETVKDASGNETSACKFNNDIEPLDGGWTDDEGKYSNQIVLPSYVSKVYIVSKAFYATRLMEAEIVDGVLKASESDYNGQPETRAALGNNAISHERGRFNRLGWDTRLGSFHPVTGQINYAYKGKDPKLTFTRKEREEFCRTIYSVLNTLDKCPEEYRKSNDLYITGDDKSNYTEIVLTALGGWTCWNNSLGYYYYEDGKTPKSLDDVKIFTIFPNTQTKWNKSTYQASPRGVEEGTSVQLKFFGEDYLQKGSTKFPKGYRIGFVLACNAWDYKFTGYGSHTQTNTYRSCSTEGLSSKGANNIDVHTAMFKDKNGNIAICFEDFKDDENFTDVLFALKANPIITDELPDVDPDLNTTIEKRGVYAFEDEWPKAGDYDMNDVLVQYTYQKTFNIYNNILNESFTFKTFFNKSTVFTNGLGFTLTNAENGNSSAYLIKKEGESEFSQATGDDKIISEGNVILLTNNVKINPNAEYKITRQYGEETSSKNKETTIDAFIYRSSNGGRLEVHCPMQKPTSKVDNSLFGQEDDRSVPEQGIYYISNKENIYPFAFYLSNANIDDIAELKDFDKNERVPINELYPEFINWAKFGENPDWYKKK